MMASEPASPDRNGANGTGPIRPRYDLTARARTTVLDAKRYTKFVRHMKRALSLSAFAIIFSVLAFFFVQRAPRELALSYERLGNIENDLAMINPRLTVADAQGNPFVITAKEAVQDANNPKRVMLKTIEAEMNTPQGWANARAGHGAGLVDTGRHQHGGVLLAQVGEAQILADLDVAVNFDVGLLKQLHAAIDHGLLQLESGDAVNHQAAGAVVAVVDLDLIAQLAQLFRRRHAAGAGTDDADRLFALNLGCHRFHPALFPGGIGDVLLNGADGHRAVLGLLQHATAFAQSILRAYAPTDFGHVVGGRGDRVGLFQAAFCYQFEPVGNVVLHGAMHLAERNPALLAARGLVTGIRFGPLLVDLAEILAARLGFALGGRLLLEGQELQHVPLDGSLGRDVLRPGLCHGRGDSSKAVLAGAIPTMLAKTRIFVCAGHHSHATGGKPAESAI